AQLPEFTRILSSPLSRCRLLAEAVAEARGHNVTIDPRLTEMDFGRWESLLWSAIPRTEIDAWRDDFLDARPHGGESVRDLADRVQAALDDAARGPVPVLVVTHAGVIKAAKAARGMAGGWQSENPFGDWVRMDWP
ncbi:MAG: histidine phosphatase family protein, partial [Pararhodobacter sp.]